MAYLTIRSKYYFWNKGGCLFKWFSFSGRIHKRAKGAPEKTENSIVVAKKGKIG
ncbi:MAG: hypothetical protein ACP5IB_07605 [Thermoplasmata archaeon]